MDYDSENRRAGNRKARVFLDKANIYIYAKKNVPEEVKPVPRDHFKDYEKYVADFIPIKDGPSKVQSAHETKIQIIRVFKIDDKTKCHIDIEREDSNDYGAKLERYSYGQLCQKGSRPEGVYTSIHRGGFILKSGPGFDDSNFANGIIVPVNEAENAALEALKKAKDELIDKMESGSYDIKIPKDKIEKAVEKIEEIEKNVPELFTGRAKEKGIHPYIVDYYNPSPDPKADVSEEMEKKCYYRLMRKVDFIGIEYSEDFQKEIVIENPRGIIIEDPEIEPEPEPELEPEPEPEPGPEKPEDIPERIEIKGFGFGESTLPTNEGEPGVEGIEDFKKLCNLDSETKSLIEITSIEGHTDNIGVAAGTTDYSNLDQLSNQRANAVREKLVDFKSLPANNTLKSDSEASVTGENTTKADKAVDRKVVITWKWHGGVWA